MTEGNCRNGCNRPRYSLRFCKECYDSVNKASKERRKRLKELGICNVCGKQCGQSRCTECNKKYNSRGYSKRKLKMKDLMEIL